MTDTLNQIVKHRNQSIQPFIKQKNGLTSAAYKMSLQEKRLLVMGASKITTPTSPDYGNDSFTVTAIEFAEEFGISKDRAYAELKQCVKSLYERSITYRNTEAKTGETFRWITGHKYWENEGTVQITFTKNVLDHIRDFSGGSFTQTYLHDVAQLKTFHAIRLHELLMRYRDTGWYSVSVEELRRILQLEYEYPKFSALMKYVITPSITQLNDNLNLNITVEFKTDRRKTSALTFYFNKQEHIERTAAESLTKKIPPSTRDTSLAEDISDKSWAPRSHEQTQEGLKHISEIIQLINQAGTNSYGQ